MASRSLFTQLRGISSSSVMRCEAASGRPNVQLGGVAGRYSLALYNIAQKANSIPVISEHLQAFKQARSSSPTLRQILDDPTIPRVEKAKSLEAALAKTQLDQNLKQFLGTCAHSGRLAELDEIMDGFDKLVAAHKNEVEAVITTADPISAGIKKELTDLIQKNFVQKGRSLVLTTEVDPSVLGGMTVMVGTKYIDLSVRTQLQEIRNVLYKSVAPAMSPALRKHLDQSDAKSFTLKAALESNKEYSLDHYHNYRKQYDSLLNEAALRPKTHAA
eukprot:Rmarinus@m.22823